MSNKYGELNIKDTVAKIIDLSVGGYIDSKYVWRRVCTEISSNEITNKMRTNIKQLISRILNDFRNNLNDENFVILNKKIFKISNKYWRFDINENIEKYILEINNNIFSVINNLKDNKEYRISNAVASSTIENELIDIKNNEISTVTNKDKHQELQNFLELDRQLENWDNRKISKTVISEMHKIYFKNIKKFKDYLGKYKTQQNYISNGYVPCDPLNLELELDAWIVEFNKKENNKKIILMKAGLLHAWFERIHPFNDGNGRLGRYLIEYYFFIHGITKKICFPSSKLFLLIRDRYIHSLNSINLQSKFEYWNRFWIYILKRINNI